MAPPPVSDPETMSTPRLLYRDAHLVAVHKPAGLLVHRTDLARGEREFLVQRLRDRLGQRVYPVHRLDRPTAGVMLFALSPAVAARLGAAFAERRVAKRYLAVVRGLGPEEARLDNPLREEDGRRPKAEMPALEAITVVRRLAGVELPVQVDRYPRSRYSLMEAQPLTGRRHQLRRHLAASGHPIIGDAKHGKGNHNRYFRDVMGCPGLLLAATRLALEHPVEGHRLVIEAALEIPMARLFSRFGWSAHLPLDAVRRAGAMPTPTREAITPP
jgi:tRNA pseudouridine65 synthase